MTLPCALVTHQAQKAARKLEAWASSSKAGPRPLNSTRPLCNRTMASCSSTSSTRWVAHKAPTARFSHQAPHHPQHAFAGGNVEARRGLVQQQTGWFVQ